MIGLYSVYIYFQYSTPLGSYLAFHIRYSYIKSIPYTTTFYKQSNIIQTKLLILKAIKSNYGVKVMIKMIVYKKIYIT